MKNPLENESQKSGLLLGSEPLDEIRNRRAYAKSDDDKGDFADGDTGDDSDSEDTEGTDSDLTDSKDADGKD
jgi:hypothetical protein